MSIMIDVDSTLNPFYRGLYKELLKINPKLKPPMYWDEWGFYKRYNITSKQFYKTVSLLHNNIEEKPFFFARDLTQLLMFFGYEVIICSHRNKDINIQKELSSWLNKHDISYHKIILTDKKWELFEKFDVTLVIDDSPKVLDKAEEYGINYTGIKYPWNKKFHNKLEKNLSGIYWKVLLGNI
jgi:uncharacterized HAD superfamily protein